MATRRDMSDNKCKYDHAKMNTSAPSIDNIR